MIYKIIWGSNMNRFNKKSENKTFSLSAVALALTTIGYIASPSVFAAEKEVSENDTEIIEVTGIRSSIQKSLATKQDATAFVDAISAEDVGKLPDYNVAEALQRVAGVAIQRNRGEGDFVTIRGLGPDFVKGTLNGRTLLSSTETVDANFNGNAITSTGRATNFDILPSEVVTSLEVSKSASASQIEGGVAGSVDVKTARPLTLGNKAAFSATGVYRDFNSETDPSVSGLYSWSNDDNFGVLASVSYSERNIREDFSRQFFWLPASAFAFASELPADARLDTNNDGTGDADYGNVFQPLSNNAEVYQEKRERLTATTTIQWVGDDSEFVLDVLYSKREVAESHQNLIHLPFANRANFGAQNEDGSYPTLNLVNGGVANNITSTFRPELTTDLQDYEDDLFSVGANFSTQFDNLNVSGDLSYSKAEGSNNFDRVRWDADYGTFEFNTRLDQNGFHINQLNQGQANSDLANPENFKLTVFDQRFATNEDTDFALKLDLEYDLDNDVFSSVQVGLRYSSREKILARAQKGGGVSVGNGNHTAADVGSFNRGASDFLGGQWDTNFDYSTLVFPDNSAALEFITAQQAALSEVTNRTDEQNALLAQYNAVLAPIDSDPASSFDTTEDTVALYLQANIDTEIGGLPLTGNVGFRYVDTSTKINGSAASFRVTDVNGLDTSQGFDEIETLAASPISFDNDYDYFLPSLNLRLEVAEGMFVRASASQTITRPVFERFLPAFSASAIAPVDTNQDGFAVTLNSGNPGLQPFESTNYDIGFEYYFGDASAVYIAAFRKDFDGFVVNSNTAGPFSEIAGTTIPVTGVIRRDGQPDSDVGNIPVDLVNQPLNAGSGDITGVEVGLQQSFESGFGYIANVSTADSEATFQLPGQTTATTIDFTGVSDLSYNLTGYYESGPFQARLSYNYRDEYVSAPNAVAGGQLVNDEYGQLDASFSYDLNENITFVFNAINLNDEDQKVFQDLPDSAGGSRQYYSLSHVGQRFTFGIRGSF